MFIVIFCGERIGSYRKDESFIIDILSEEQKEKTREYEYCICKHTSRKDSSTVTENIMHFKT